MTNGWLANDIPDNLGKNPPLSRRDAHALVKFEAELEQPSKYQFYLELFARISRNLLASPALSVGSLSANANKSVLFKISPHAGLAIVLAGNWQARFGRRRAALLHSF
jgi:hypothetical protein